ncbi:MAG: transposase [Bacteroidetes bacterium]|nr:transposase [Bacteroidota bacterium]
MGVWDLAIFKGYIGAVVTTTSQEITVLDAQIEPLSVGEKTLAYRHLEKVRQGDFLLMDRGYPSLRLFFELVSKGVQFCVRMNEHWWRTVKEFEATGQQEGIVRYKLGGKARQALRHLGEIVDKELVSRICADFGQRAKGVPCTTLADAQRPHRDVRRNLYHCRWGCREAFCSRKESGSKRSQVRLRSRCDRTFTPRSSQ